MKPLFAKKQALWLFLFLHVAVFSQVKDSLDLEYLLKSAVIKNTACSIVFANEEIDTSDFFPIRHRHQSPLSTLRRIPGFGYTPHDVEIQITALDLQYPKKGWKLYKVGFFTGDINNRAYEWDIYRWYHPELGREGYTKELGSLADVFFIRNALLALTEEREVKFISGFRINHAIAHHFKLDKKKPETYLPFLERKLFSICAEKIVFSHLDNGRLVFKAFKNLGKEDEVEYEYRLNPEMPDQVEHKTIRNLKPYSSDKFPPFTPSIQPFQDLQDKQRYLLNALMKNIYLYRTSHFEDLADRLNIDTLSWEFREGPSDWDKILPNYDEYLGEFQLVKQSCLYIQSKRAYFRCFDDLPPNKFPIYEPWDRSSGLDKLVVGYFTESSIELYRFYHHRREVLVRRPGKYTKGQMKVEAPWRASPLHYGVQQQGDPPFWFRYDPYYPVFQEEGQEIEAWVDTASPPAGMGITLSDLFYNSFPPYGSRDSYELEPEEIKRHCDHYLVGLNVRTREVYFISGKGIYLSHASAVYRRGKNEWEPISEPEELSRWALSGKLAYIEDRLYRYRVKPIKESQIVERNAEKLVVEVEGEEYQKPLRIRATLYEDRPEKLELEIWTP